MSWLFKTLQSDDPDSPTPTAPNDAVIDDLSVIGETIGRQLRGVADFLAPPPTVANRAAAPDASSSKSESETLLGIRNDLAEIGGSFKNGLSLLSSNKAVTGISKFASKLLQYRDDDDYDDDGIPGITEEVVEFVKEISERSECWTDFPLSLDDDFEMSDAQQEHATAVEQLVPSLKDLRMDLKSQIEDGQFWTIYFILLLPRLNDHDFELLSSPKIIETRNILLEKLQNKRDAVKKSNTPSTAQGSSNVSETKAESILPREKRVNMNATRNLEAEDEGSTVQWLEDTDIDPGHSKKTQKGYKQDEDVSFSDLEDDSDFSSSKRSHDMKSTSSHGGSNDWVQLNQSCANRGFVEKSRRSVSREKDSEGDSSDWLAVDDFD